MNLVLMPFSQFEGRALVLGAQRGKRYVAGRESDFGSELSEKAEHAKRCQVAPKERAARNIEDSGSPNIIATGLVQWPSAAIDHHRDLRQLADAEQQDEHR